MMKKYLRIFFFGTVNSSLKHQRKNIFLHKNISFLKLGQSCFKLFSFGTIKTINTNLRI